MKYTDWTLIDWEGNTSLGYKCWRKSFGNGHVSVGVGEFMSIVFSYGDNSVYSLSSTRWRKDGPISEVEAMQKIDADKGKYRKEGR